MGPPGKPGPEGGFGTLGPAGPRGITVMGKVVRLHLIYREDLIAFGTDLNPLSLS